jgi:hypothetical protein
MSNLLGNCLTLAKAVKLTVYSQAKTITYGWGARDRTWECRNQNPELSLSNQTLSFSQTANFQKTIKWLASNCLTQKRSEA